MSADSTWLLRSTSSDVSNSASSVPESAAAGMGDYPALGRRTAAAIPGAKLVAFDDLGHSPQVEAPARFEAALLQALRMPR